MTKAMQTALMTTVNAPYQQQVSAGGLALALTNGEIASAQVSSFFTETDVEMQKAFAADHGITLDALVHVASQFQAWSGQPVALAA